MSVTRETTDVAAAQEGRADEIEQHVKTLLAEMSLEEKIGQLHQVDATGDHVPDTLKEEIRAGRIGAVLNQTNPDVANELQRIATEESRRRIPLLVGRDVIHGFETIAPIPLGQAASWNPNLVRDAARLAAEEASCCGVNWTFAPMIDVSRDPRWGRIAESFGEDPYLTAVLGVAMIEGFQGENLADPQSIAACAKHFAGYGASESGRDYNTTNIPENELRNVYLPPFKAAVDAGVATMMSSFSDIDGVPATANEFLMRRVLRGEWGFDGFVVSDWDSVRQLSVHGLTQSDRQAACEAASAGVDMEMTGGAYISHLAALVWDGTISAALIEQMAANVLRIKARLGLFERPYAAAKPAGKPERNLDLAKQAALESIVLLKNDNQALPLRVDGVDSVAIIGPMADAPYEQLGTWVFDGAPELSITPRQAIEAFVNSAVDTHYAEGMASSRAHQQDLFDEAIAAGDKSDAILLFLGEESILSGEAHCRADIDLPGDQAKLVKALKKTGKPLIIIILAGRPLTLSNIIEDADAILFAWHPGTMGGPALCDLIFGVEAPSGKLPVSFPKVVGQVPIYYNHKNTGRPPSPNEIVHIDDIEVGARQTSLGMTAFHLDAGYKPLFPFGYGLSYTQFAYRNLQLSASSITPDETLHITVDLENCGDTAGAEVVQLYIRDLVGSVTRPVKELKGFQKILLQPGQITTVAFTLSAGDLSFYRRDKTFGAEPGEFRVWVGGCSDSGLSAAFSLTS